ncbi:AT-hook motif nuclear-localized protein [Balamuthia mandrillaris]
MLKKLGRKSIDPTKQWDLPDSLAATLSASSEPEIAALVEIDPTRLANHNGLSPLRRRSMSSPKAVQRTKSTRTAELELSATASSYENGRGNGAASGSGKESGGSSAEVMEDNLEKDSSASRAMRKRAKKEEKERKKKLKKEEKTKQRKSYDGRNSRKGNKKKDNEHSILETNFSASTTSLDENNNMNKPLERTPSKRGMITQSVSAADMSSHSSHSLASSLPPRGHTAPDLHVPQLYIDPQELRNGVREFLRGHRRERSGEGPAYSVDSDSDSSREVSPRSGAASSTTSPRNPLLLSPPSTPYPSASSPTSPTVPRSQLAFSDPVLSKGHKRGWSLGGDNNNNNSQQPSSSPSRSGAGTISAGSSSSSSAPSSAVSSPLHRRQSLNNFFERQQHHQQSQHHPQQHQHQHPVHSVSRDEIASFSASLLSAAAAAAAASSRSPGPASPRVSSSPSSSSTSPTSSAASSPRGEPPSPSSTSTCPSSSSTATDLLVSPKKNPQTSVLHSLANGSSSSCSSPSSASSPSASSSSREPHHQQQQLQTINVNNRHSMMPRRKSSMNNGLFSGALNNHTKALRKANSNEIRRKYEQKKYIFSISSVPFIYEVGHYSLNDLLPSSSPRSSVSPPSSPSPSPSSSQQPKSLLGRFLVDRWAKRNLSSSSSPSSTRGPLPTPPSVYSPSGH